MNLCKSKSTICDLSDPFWVKEFPQIEQTYGLRPSCVIRCRVRFVLVLNAFWQTSQRLSGFAAAEFLLPFCGEIFAFSLN